MNADNSQELYVRDQLNRGVVPDGIDLHCLAGLIKVCSISFPFSFILHFLCFVNMANSCVHRLALSFSVILICTDYRAFVCYISDIPKNQYTHQYAAHTLSQ